jgi:N,N-dimethylformamidase
MLIGYVSDERYVALADVLVDFESVPGSTAEPIATRSRATGALYADLAPGEYLVTLSKTGYGSKRVRMHVDPDRPYQFRLLSDGLLGYAWPKWVRAGEQSEFRVHAVAAYKLELYRYGLHKEFIRNLGWFDEHGPRATMQITPDGDYSQTGVEWNKFGYASRNHKQYATAPSRSGLYYFHARSERGEFFSFPWIVAPVKPTAQVAVLVSNINWNAYNSFGGRSNYIHADRLPHTPTINARLELPRYLDPDFGTYETEVYAPLSFDRPESINHVPLETQVNDPIEGRAACHVAPAEWRLLGWLEREGFDYDVYAETQFHAGQLDLNAYRTLIISTHPEYWSKEMYYQLKNWVFERGGKLLYLGGNGLNCEVEFLNPTTMTVRNGEARRLNAEPHLESRFGMRQESEANLLGVVYTEAGIMTAAPYRVLDAQHWVFDGTGLSQGDRFGTRSLHERIPGGASGHETDKVSPSSPTNVHRLAKGENPDEGGADMVIFDTPSGGGVFSAGSICWPSSLLVDDAVSRITANVIRRFSE